MRRMRLPLIILILVYFFSTLLMTMVPGVDDQGNVYRMGALDAAYLIAIMQTTIGFSEIPYTFTDSQRFLMYLLLFPNVVAWLYSVGTLLGLILDKQFQSAFQRNRFSRQVLTLKEPFYIVCGFGNTGSMIVSGLLARGIRAVVIEKSEDTVRQMKLSNEFSNVPAIHGQSSERPILTLAGLTKPNCLGVIATTYDDHVNLTIAITVKLLQPQLKMIARSEIDRISDNMASFDTDSIINPYEIFAERLHLALMSPVKYLVQDWLISVPGSRLRTEVKPPTGAWIVCGAGRFGGRMIEQLQKNALPVTVVDVHPDRLPAYENAILGRGTEADTLIAAGIESAVGIIAATNDDIDNLSIIMTARNLNPDLFFITRQERRQHDALFDSFNADLVARRSLIIARRILSLVSTPLLPSFLQQLFRSDERFAQNVKTKLEHVLQQRAPHIWMLELKGEHARSIRFVNSRSRAVTLDDISRHARSEDNELLPCVCLSLERGAQSLFLPGLDTELQVNDRLLFAGRDLAHKQMLWTLNDPHSLLGNVTGTHLPRGSIWRWISER